MLRRTAGILVIPSLLLLTSACRRIDAPTARGDALPREDMQPTAAVPASWGNLVSVSSATLYPDLVQLWFQDSSGNVRMAVFNVQTNKLLSSTQIRRQ
jgi:hypothetical protein